MSVANWIQIGVFLALVFTLAPFLGKYMARVYEGERHILSFLSPVERFLYRICGIDAKKEMSWKQYLAALLVFNALGFVTLMALLMTQAWLPINPHQVGNMSWHLALNTAISFMTNTNWQNYAGEASASYLTQMAGFAVHNFLSAASGMAAMLALIRGIRNRPKGGMANVMQKFSSRLHYREQAAAPAPKSEMGHATLGNFWVDSVRSILYILLPLSIILAVLLISQGVVQSFSPYVNATTVEGANQAIPMGPAASQIAIKQLGSNGGGFFGVNSAHPFENPTPFSNLLELLSVLLIPAAIPFLFGRMVKSRGQGYALFAVKTTMFMLGLVAILFAEYGINGVTGGAGSMEGKEVRFGISASAVWAQTTTVVSNGSVNAMHDSFSGLGGMIPMINMMLGEVVFGGLGAGMYGLLVFLFITVFIAGLMVGRTPEYLGKRIETREVQLSVLAIVAQGLVVLFLAAIASVTKVGLSSLSNQGPHGLSEIMYWSASTVGNNGSAFGGLAANTVFYNVTGALAMLIGRFVVIIPVIAIGGSLAAKTPIPASVGTFATNSMTFVVLLILTIVIVTGLNFLPALTLGPIMDHFLALRGIVF
jgi:K+-transporting ATPase ATPase A chain